jgi:hypothetical protein
MIDRRMESLMEEGSMTRASSSLPAHVKSARRPSFAKPPVLAAAGRCARSALDETATRDAANSDPAGFIAGLDGPAFIDEIHHAPDLLLELKKAVDDDTVRTLVITGSTNTLINKKILNALPVPRGVRAATPGRAELHVARP